MAGTSHNKQEHSYLYIQYVLICHCKSDQKLLTFQSTLTAAQGVQLDTLSQCEAIWNICGMFCFTS